VQEFAAQIAPADPQVVSPLFFNNYPVAGDGSSILIQPAFLRSENDLLALTLNFPGR
jgi:hypothetical protein